MSPTGAPADTRDSIFLFDGSALAYRSHFALANARLSAQGLPTGALFGFATELHRILERVQPKLAAMVFDTSAPTFRHERFEEYKATRERMPEDLVQQLPLMEEVSELLGCPVVTLDGWEADDVIATLAVQAAAQGMPAYIVTGDKDFMQVVSEQIRLYNIMKKGQEVVVIGPDEVVEHFGVPPERVIDVLALMGDSADNVPGVPGIGPKTASNLVSKHGGLDAIYADLDAAATKKTKERLEEFKDQAYLSRELVTIDLETPVPVTLEKLNYEGPDHEKAADFFKRFEFRTLAEAMVRGNPEDAQDDTPKDYAIVQSESELDAMLEELMASELTAVDTETDSLDAVEAKLVGLSFSTAEGKAWYVPVNASPPLLEDPEGERRGHAILERLKPFLGSDSARKCGQNLKYDTIVLSRHGVELQGIETDSLIASYLCETSERERNLDALALRHFGHVKIKTEELIGKGKKQITMDEVPIDTVGTYACEDADYSLRLSRLFLDRLDQEELRSLHDEIEIPLIPILARMQIRGLRLDRERLEAMAADLSKQVEALETTIYELAGREFTINSPKQLGGILFEELEIHKEIGYRPKRTKTGYGTGQEVLEALDSHPLPGKILEYRSLSKLLNTYIRPLPDLINPRTGRIHGSFNQAVAATGRLSSSDPNLQNIPIRSELGRPIRSAFRAKDEDHCILSADYSQIELRLLAHLADDPAMIEAFRSGVDIHRDTAARVFGVDVDEVDLSLRSKAKAINFGIIYGMGAHRLARQTELELDEAKDFIERYFDTFPAVRDYLERCKREVSERGYALTMLGRRREIADINSKNGRLRAAAENMAVNTPIQGSAADLLKLAMIRIDGRLRERKLEGAMILTVHDELVFELPKSELDEVRELVRSTMEGVHELSVPLVVDVGVGDDWLEAHS